MIVSMYQNDDRFNRGMEEHGTFIDYGMDDYCLSENSYNLSSLEKTSKGNLKMIFSSK